MVADEHSGEGNVVAGTSLVKDAYRRLRRNRMAMAGMVIVIFMTVVGYSAPLISRYITHFSYDEQHTLQKFAGPGSMDISHDFPTFDGDKRSFDFFDVDQSGFLECFWQCVEVDPEDPSGYIYVDCGDRDPAAEQGQKRGECRSDGGCDDGFFCHEGLCLPPVVQRCPELDRVVGKTAAVRFFHVDLIQTFDTVSGLEDPRNSSCANACGDGRVSRLEFPTDDHPAVQKYRTYGLSTVGLFEKLDMNKDGFIERSDIVRSTRYMRHNKDLLMRRYDKHPRDNRLSRDEYPGAPELHTFLLGTDSYGRDVLTRLIYGARISITIGLLATLVSLLIGVTWGAIAGYSGGRVDLVMMAIVDVLYGLPFMFIVILLIVIAGRSTFNLFIALGAVQWLTMSRVVRGQVLSIKERDYIEAARAVGVGRTSLIVRHILPNVLGPVVIYSTLMVPAVILEEAFLSFLGLGVPAPLPSWGTMISEGTQYFGGNTDFYWVILFPGLMLSMTLFSLNFLGDGVRDALDPQASKS